MRRTACFGLAIFSGTLILAAFVPPTSALAHHSPVHTQRILEAQKQQIRSLSARVDQLEGIVRNLTGAADDLNKRLAVEADTRSCFDANILNVTRLLGIHLGAADVGVPPDGGSCARVGIAPPARTVQSVGLLQSVMRNIRLMSDWLR